MVLCRMDVEQVSKNYNLWILVRRWAATWLDNLLFILVGVLLIPLARIEIAAAIGIGFLFSLIYYPLTEGLVGKTVGKFLCGLTVVNAQGGPPGVGKAMIRTLWRLLEVNPFLVGGIPAGIAVLASKTRQRCGDNTAGTYVLCDEDLGSSWARRFWALPGAIITTLAAVGFFVFGGTVSFAADRQKPQTISFAEAMKNPPKEGYVEIKNCEMDITEAFYVQNVGEYSTTYTAYIPLRDIDQEKASLLLKTEDEKTIAIVKKLDALDTAEASQKIIDAFVEEHLEELDVMRDVKGTVSSGDYNLDLSGEKGEAFVKEDMNEDFHILNEGDTPFSGEGILSIIAGFFLGGLTAIFWIVALIYASLIPPQKQN